MRQLTENSAKQSTVEHDPESLIKFKARHQTLPQVKWRVVPDDFTENLQRARVHARRRVRLVKEELPKRLDDASKAAADSLDALAKKLRK